MKASHKVGGALIVCYLVAWLDRMAINMTIPFMAEEFKIGPDKIGWILSAFFLGYSLFQIPGGMLADRFGPRKVILAALGWWSAFTALTGMVGSLTMMLITRFFFGIGEGVFPASVWSVLGKWFSKKNRATANALVISSIALGPAITPIILAPILHSYGWRTCFYILGLMGFACFAFAYFVIANSIREAKNVSPEELEEYEADSRSAAANTEVSLEGASFSSLLKNPIIWVFFFNGLIFNITMYGWLNWLPSYLMKVKNLDLKNLTWAASMPFMFGAIGCMIAGWVSDKWFRGNRKWLVIASMLIGGVCLYYFTRVNDVTTYMILQCVAGFMLFMACGAAWTLPMILLPEKLMGSGSGFINTGGQIGGFLTNIIIGYYIQYKGGDYAAGFDVMLGALILSVILIVFGVHEKTREIKELPEESKTLSGADLADSPT
ncbi:MAG: MFS transporter [Candidatus Riflebacteria bacterium]|nr:MFS transporter [Candidatus Riflebacteria bacterium]